MDYKLKTERTHYLGPSTNIVIKTLIEGRPSREEMENAVRAAVAANAGLNCKIVQDVQGEAFYVPCEKPVISIEFISDADEHVWKEIAYVQEKIVFDLEKGEFVRFFILEHDNTTELMLIASHLAGDGNSIVRLTKDILEVLEKAGPDRDISTILEYKPLTMLGEHHIPQDSALSLIYKIILKFVNLTRSKKIFTFTEFKEMFNKYWQDSGTFIVTKRIEADKVALLKTRAKAHNVTLNSVLTTAVLAALPEENRVVIAASVRPDDIKGMGNFVTGISIKHSYNKNLSFWENAGAVHSTIYSKLQNSRQKYFLLNMLMKLKSSMIDAPYFTKHSGFLSKTLRGFMDFISNIVMKGMMAIRVGITNLTSADFIGEYTRYPVSDITFVPPYVPKARRIIGAVSYKGAMTLSLHLPKTHDISEIDTIFDSILASCL